jgi:4-hydroxy-3-polyprenylbenzoate decarboxylase
VLINATLKGTYAPVALPTREFMENARAIWERLGLPPLKPESPWHGYELGHWPSALAREAKLATDGDYFKTGTEAEKHRRNDIIMNTPMTAAKK